ncbi:MAG: LapA family protein [Salinibacter sp.]
MRLGLLFSLILAIGAVIFALANPGTMEVDFVLFETSGSTALILLLTFGLGVIVGLLCTLPNLLRKRSKLKTLQKNKDAGTGASSSAGPKSPSGSSQAEGSS